MLVSVCILPTLKLFLFKRIVISSPIIEDFILPPFMYRIFYSAFQLHRKMLYLKLASEMNYCFYRL